MMSKKPIKLLILDVDGTLTDGGVYISEKGEQSKKFNVKDGMGIVVLNKMGIEVGIISHSSVSEMISNRANTLKLNYVYVGQKPKLEVLQDWLQELKITLEEVAYMGDDINDLDVIEVCGFTACPSDAMAIVKEKVDHVMTMKGGEGAVREFIDHYLLDKPLGY
ncbi:MAG: HAD-IIIA family hydrolase [Cytophagales bacterium]|nr:HAD-IIIA family hydrolase [Cytophagales bacterium]